MNFRQNIAQSINRYITASLWLFLAFLGIRLFEIALLAQYSNIAFGANCVLNLKGFSEDILYFGKITLFLFPLFFIGSVFFEKKTFVTLRILLAIYLLISTCLVIFFSIAGTPLDRIVFMYSLSDIIEILSASQKADWWNYLLIVGVPTAFFLLSKIQVLHKFWINCLILVALLICIFISSISFSTAPNQETYYVIENKVAYFFKSLSYEAPKDSLDKESLQKYSAEFQEKFTENKFTNPSYPFLHKEESLDVLSQFFDLKAEKPNFVFVVVEGLGKEFSGYNSILPSATPFLDSLSNEGLSWSNCFSTSQRTICALPSIFGALPYGKSGFMNYKESAPQFNSLLTILHDNNYQSTFAYGGWLCFDDMCHFLKLNNIDKYVDQSQYDSTAPQNTWGLYDDFLFNETVKSIDFEDKPRIDVYLTLTTHDPFEYPDEDIYVKQYKKLLESNPEHPYISEGNVRKVASYLYLDNSLRKLINLYKNKPNFDNTIFVITGDHNFNMQLEPIVLNNVPLVIWSPLLAQKHRFPGIVSHRDITPSILALLRNNYEIKTPENVTWINQGLNISNTFDSKTFCPIMDLGRELNCCIYKNTLIWKNLSYSIQCQNDRLSIQPIDDTSDFVEFFNAYKNLDMYVMENNALIENWHHDNSNKLKTIYSVNSRNEQTQFLQEHFSGEISSFNGHQNTVLSENQEFPANLFQYTFSGKENFIQLEVDFDNYLPLCNDSTSKISFVTEIRRDGKCIYWSNELVNGPSFKGYDSWQKFHTKIGVRSNVYQTQPGDVILFYLWNNNKRKFYISDIRINASAIFAED